MITFEIEYSVKFRAWLITFGTISGKREVTVAAPVPIPPRELLKFNDRGLAIVLRVK